MKTTLKSMTKYTKTGNFTDRFLASKGNNIFYVEFTDELIVCDVSPKEGKLFHVYICLGKAELNIGPVTYIGKL